MYICASASWCGNWCRKPLVVSCDGNLYPARYTTSVRARASPYFHSSLFHPSNAYEYLTSKKIYFLDPLWPRELYTHTSGVNFDSISKASCKSFSEQKISFVKSFSFPCQTGLNICLVSCSRLKLRDKFTAFHRKLSMRNFYLLVFRHPILGKYFRNLLLF